MTDPTSNWDARPADCAGGLIVRQGRILLGLRSPDSEAYPNVWDVFGGHVEDGETVEQALVRELQEELDIVPTAFERLTTFREPDPRSNGVVRYHVFKVAAWSGPGPRLRGAEHTEIRWCTCEEALALDLAAPEYRALFRDHVV